MGITFIFKVVLMSKIYQEDSDSTFSSNGKHYNLNIIFRLTHKQKPISLPISTMTWVLQFTKPDKNRVKAADLSAPLLVIEYDTDNTGKKWLVVDGLHRLTKASELDFKTLPCIIVSEAIMKQALIS